MRDEGVQFTFRCLCGFRTIFVLLALLMGLFSTHAMQSKSDSTTIFSSKVYFRKGSDRLEGDFHGNAMRMDCMHNFIDSLSSDSLLKFEIIGSASPEGSKTFNEKLSNARALALARYLDIYRHATITTIVADDDNHTHWLLDRYAEFRAYGPVNHTEFTSNVITDSLKPETSIKITPPDSVNTRKSTNCIYETTSKGVDSTLASTKSGVHIFMSTNMLYDAALIPNLGFGICFANRYTLFVDWSHAWWNNRDRRRYWRVYGGDLELRRQLGGGKSSNPLSGHRAGVYTSILTYDFQFGRSHTGVMGDKYNYAVGLSYGYSLPVSYHLNIDFSIGIGYMWGRYKKQRLIGTHDVWQSTHSRQWFGPTKAEVSLIWLIGRHNANIKRSKGEMQ